jgi:hypothetical protein
LDEVTALTVIVPTIPGRESMLSRLLHGLGEQDLTDAEVLVIYGEGGLGHKVNLGLSVAYGTFSVIVDDDDELAADYVPTVVAAITANPDADYIGHRIAYIHDGRWTASITHRLEGDPLWDSEPRGVGPKCPFRTAIGASVDFEDDYTADRRWSQAVHALCYQGAFIDRHLYRYDFRPGGSVFVGAGGGDVGAWPFDPLKFRWLES